LATALAVEVELSAAKIFRLKPDVDYEFFARPQRHPNTLILNFNPVILFSLAARLTLASDAFKAGFIGANS
jgi:hypothetical protein